ncbi:MAG: NAD(P)-dependent oxidoreductase [Propionibacteriaceae bacterium]|nr:NAD(P)-dependent oxidoreductase [Propionibacteriaceae bacterium]
MPHTIGFIGLGVMGSPMARHILGALKTTGGHLLVRDFDRSRHEDLIASGAEWADTPGELAQRCDIVIAMVPTIANVHELVHGPDGLAAHTTKAWTLVVSSTCSPHEVRELQAGLEAAEIPIRVVDAPVSGGAEGAESGTLSIMVGGDEEVTRPVCEVLNAAGEATRMGPLGAGQVAKACNQLIVAAEVVALAEASLLAERAGLDVAQLFGVLQKGYAASRILEVKAHRFANRDHSPSGPARFMVKDLRAVADEARQSGLALVSIEHLQEVFQAVTDQGMGDNDTSVVQALIESRSAPFPPR